MQVDAVEHGAGELIAIALDLFRGAAAAPAGFAQIAARARVHGRDQLETGGETNPVASAGDDDLS